MRSNVICLISAATATDFEDVADVLRPEVRKVTQVPHLGVLTLAAILERRGAAPSIVNLNDLYYAYVENGGSGVDRFAPWAADVIVATGAEIFGFSSICNSYPTSLRIAASVKHLRRDATIIFGGPQASVVDVPTLATFPFVDFVLRGESDETLPLFLSEVSGNGNFSSVPGLTWRSSFGPMRNGPAPVVRDLDALPLPAFHLTGELRGLDYAPLELGRGCPFACTFCSTNDFFRRNFRLRSPERVLADMRRIAAAWNIRHFDLTHDMFTVDRRKVVAFCHCMLSSGEKFTWGCSARTDCVDDELLELMARAGCRSMFFGVESGSARMQKVMDKSLDISVARQVIASAERLGIYTTVSIITGFPEETWDDVRDSVAIYLYSLAHSRSSPQLNLLAPLAETPICTKHRDQLVLEELCSDQGHQGRTQNALDRELVRTCPDIFPNFYLLPIPNLDRDSLSELREFLLNFAIKMRWLLVALYRSRSDVLDLFFEWRKRRIQLRPELHGWPIRSYYLGEQSRVEFASFVLDYAGEQAPAVITCLAAFYRTLAISTAAGGRAFMAENTGSATQATDIPVRMPGVHVLQFDWDIQTVIDCVKCGKPLEAIDRSPRYFRTRPEGPELRLLRTTPLIATVLFACNGVNTVADFTQEIADLVQTQESSTQGMAERLLEMLVSEGLVRLHRPEPQHSGISDRSHSAGTIYSGAAT